MPVTFIPYNPAADPNQFIGQAAAGLGQGLGRFFGGRQEARDIQQLGQGLGVNLPQLQSSAGRQLAMQQLLGATQPITPFQQESLDLQRERLQASLAPPIPTATQGIAQQKLNLINKLQSEEAAGTITAQRQKLLDRMLAGSPMVNIELGKASPAERTSIAETRASIDALDNLKTLFDSTQTKTGPIVGRIEPTKGLLGLTTDEQESFMAATSAFKNQIIKEITGAQMSEVEAKRIMKQIPDITDPHARWRAKWQQSKKNLEMLQKRRLEILEQSGLKVPTGQVSPEMSSMTDEQLRRIAGGQ